MAHIVLLSTVCQHIQCINEQNWTVADCREGCEKSWRIHALVGDVPCLMTGDRRPTNHPQWRCSLLFLNNSAWTANPNALLEIPCRASPIVAEWVSKATDFCGFLLKQDLKHELFSEGFRMKYQVTGGHLILEI